MILRSTDVRGALKSRQRGFVLDPYRYGAAPVFPTTNLVGYWPFEEGSGTNTEDTVGSADGTLVNSPAWSSDEKLGTYGLDFSGATDRHVTVPVTQNMLTNAMTLGAWVKRTGTSDNRSVFSWRNGTSYLLLIHRSDQSGLCLQTDIGFGAVFTTTSTTLTVGTYYLVGFSLSGATFTVWINGSQLATVNRNYASLSAGFTFGNQYTNTNAWDGIIDEAFFFQGRAIDAAEWTTIYNAGAGLRP
jgi:hypothetical protein